MFSIVDPEYWRQEGQRELLEAIQRKVNMNVARNVILFVGDGMGLSTVTAARILRGQRDGKPGEETKLTFEKFPNIALAKVNRPFHKHAKLTIMPLMPALYSHIFTVFFIIWILGC